MYGNSFINDGFTLKFTGRVPAEIVPSRSCPCVNKVTISSCHPPASYLKSDRSGRFMDIVSRSQITICC